MHETLAGTLTHSPKDIINNQTRHDCAQMREESESLVAEAEAEALERLAREGAEAGGGGGKPQQRRADAGNLWPTGSGPQDVPQVRCPTRLQWDVVSSHLAIGRAQGCEIWLFPPTAGWQAAWCGLGPNLAPYTSSV